MQYIMMGPIIMYSKMATTRPIDQGHWDIRFGISSDVPGIEQPRNPLGYPWIFVIFRKIKLKSP